MERGESLYFVGMQIRRAGVSQMQELLGEMQHTELEIQSLRVCIMSALHPICGCLLLSEIEAYFGNVGQQ